MQEFWFCSSCSSMNRANSLQCYKCSAPKAEATLATVVNRNPDVVLTPGLDEEHREVAWTLMFRQRYVSAWRLGYLAAALLMAMLVLAAFVTTTGVWFVATGSLVDPSQLSPAQHAVVSVVGVAALILALVTVVTVIVHSAFLFLTSWNAPALGSGSPRFDPARAAVWWIESWLWAIRGGLAFVVPPLLCVIAIGLGGLIFGLVLGLVWAVVAFWVLGDPITNLGKPKRLLADLWDRLGIPGSADSREVTLWAAAWGSARGVEYAVSAVIFLAVIVLALLDTAGSFVGMGVAPASPGQYQLMTWLLVDLVLIVQVVADGIALFILAQITVELSRRQRVREAWVLGGLNETRAKAYADSERPDEEARSSAQPGAVAHPGAVAQPGAVAHPGAVEQPGAVVQPGPAEPPVTESPPIPAPAWRPVGQQIRSTEYAAAQPVGSPQPEVAQPEPPADSAPTWSRAQVQFGPPPGPDPQPGSAASTPGSVAPEHPSEVPPSDLESGSGI